MAAGAMSQEIDLVAGGGAPAPCLDGAPVPQMVPADEQRPGAGIEMCRRTLRGQGTGLLVVRGRHRGHSSYARSALLAALYPGCGWYRRIARLRRAAARRPVTAAFVGYRTTFFALQAGTGTLSGRALRGVVPGV